jgi:uncharacterized membrane protein
MWDRRTKFGAQFICVVVLVGLALSAQMRAAESQSSQTLIYAAYDGEDTAGKVFQTMKANQKATGEHIESYAIVTKDMKGKVHVRDQRKKDARVGAILGGVIGVLGGPVGAVAGAAAGGSIGYLTGNEVGISKDMIDKMTASLTPGSSALAVVLDDRWVKDLEKEMQQAQARQVVAEQIAAGAKQPAPATQPTPAK